MSSRDVASMRSCFIWPLSSREFTDLRERREVGVKRWAEKLESCQLGGRFASTGKWFNFQYRINYPLKWIVPHFRYVSYMIAPLLTTYMSSRDVAFKRSFCILLLSSRGFTNLREKRDVGGRRRRYGWAEKLKSWQLGGRFVSAGKWMNFQYRINDPLKWIVPHSYSYLLKTEFLWNCLPPCDCKHNEKIYAHFQKFFLTRSHVGWINGVSLDKLISTIKFKKKSRIRND